MKHLIALVMCLFFLVFCLDVKATSHFVKDKVGKTEITATHATSFLKADLESFTDTQFKRLCDPGGLPVITKLPINIISYPKANNASKYDNRLNSYWRQWHKSNLTDKIIT